MHGILRDNPKLQGRLLVILAAVLWSTSGFFAKAPIFDDWPVESRGLLLAFWRAFFAAIVLATMVRKIQFSWKLVPLVLFFAAMNWTFLSAMVLCESTVAIWLQYTAPAWVFFGSWLFFRDHPVWRDWLLLFFAAIGVTIILSAEFTGASPVGVIYGMGSGLFFAGIVVMLRWLKDYDSAWLVCLNHAFTAVLFLPIVITENVYPTGSQWIYFACFGGLQMGIPYLLFARAVRTVSSHEASGLTLLEPILVPVWVFIAWRTAPEYQFPAWTTIVGGGFILLGLLVRYIGVKRRLVVVNEDVSVTGD